MTPSRLAMLMNEWVLHPSNRTSVERVLREECSVADWCRISSQIALEFGCCMSADFCEAVEKLCPLNLAQTGDSPTPTETGQVQCIAYRRSCLNQYTTK